MANSSLSIKFKVKKHFPFEVVRAVGMTLADDCKHILGTWIERGRGTLRLNDKQLDNHALQSRLVMRTQGCLRVILNTKVHPWI